MPRAKTNKLILQEIQHLLITWPTSGAQELIGGVTYLKMRNFTYNMDLDAEDPDLFAHFQAYMEDPCMVRF